MCVSSQLIPGITIPGTWEWKETRPYSPGKFGSFFGERGLLRKEPRATRIVCRTDVVACRIVAQVLVSQSSRLTLTHTPSLTLIPTPTPTPTPTLTLSLTPTLTLAPTSTLSRHECRHG